MPTSADRLTTTWRPVSRLLEATGLREAYAWLWFPTQDGVGPLTWEAVRIPGGGESWVTKASKKLISNEQLITKMGPGLA